MCLRKTGFMTSVLSQGDAAGVSAATQPATGADAAKKLARRKKERAAERESAKAATETERRQQAELEMLMLDDSALKDASKLGAPANGISPDA